MEMWPYLVLLCCVASTSIDPNDLMNGQGLFLGSSVAAYDLDHDHTASFISWNGSNILKLEKPQGAQNSYKTGLKYSFAPSKITHVQFKFASSKLNVEDSNLRIMDKNQATLVLFRAGRSGLIRVNQKQMISFYNESVSTDADIKLTEIDLVLDWDSKTIEVFIGGKYKDKCNFFQSSLEAATTLLVYNLYPSVSYWSNLVVCQNRCYAFNSQNLPAIVVVWMLCLLAAFF